MSRQSGPPPGIELPRGYKWSWWWDTRRGCLILLCAYGGTCLLLSGVAVVTNGWVQGVSTVLASVAGLQALAALMGLAHPTERGRWHRD